MTQPAYVPQNNVVLKAVAKAGLAKNPFSRMNRNGHVHHFASWSDVAGRQHAQAESDGAYRIFSDAFPLPAVKALPDAAW